MQKDPNISARHAEIHHRRERMRSHPEGINRSANEVALEHLTRGERLADAITTVLGSWRFIIIQSSLLALWLIVNSLAWLFQWDPYPFILLNLVLSFQAAFTAPVLMMSQNRQATRDRIASELDFEVNRTAATEIDVVQQKLDLLTSQQWDALLTTLSDHKETLVVLDQRTIQIERYILESRDSGNTV